MHKVATLIAAAVLVSPIAAAAQTAAPTEEDLVQKKCSVCHTGHRAYIADPAKLKEVVDRMERKNPDWFKDTDKGHLVEGLAKLLNRPEIAARRKSWEEVVAKGKEVFADASLGTSGKSCASCHKPEALRGTADGYPAFDAASNRYISLQERLQKMIVTKQAGPELPLGDPRTVALEAYLKSLR